MYPIIPDMDKMSMFKTLTLIDQLKDDVPAFKVHALAIEELRSTIRHFESAGAKGVFVDYKLCDMPDTVAGSAARIRDAGASMLTVHSQGRIPMIEAAVKNGPPTILVVTFLTSWSDKDIEDEYLSQRSAVEVITERALWAVEGGAHGIVCSARHVGELARNPKLATLIKLVPGTRSPGVAANDQKQVDTPYNAVLKGGEKVILVGGRQITQALDPREALAAMGHEVKCALADRSLPITQAM